jgi:hypothetical protein
MRLYINEEMHGALSNDENILSEAAVSINDYLLLGKVNSDNRIYDEPSDSIEGIDDKDLSALKAAFDKIGDNYLSKTKVYFNILAAERVDKIYKTNFYCNQTTLVNENYIYRYSSNFAINEGYVNYNGNVYAVSLEGETEKAKLNSIIDKDNMELLCENNSVKNCYFTLGDINSDSNNFKVGWLVIENSLKN